MDEKDLPEWYHVIKGTLREYECIDMKAFDENGGYTAYSLLRQAAEREVKHSGSGVSTIRDAVEHCVERMEPGLTVTEQATSESEVCSCRHFRPWPSNDLPIHADICYQCRKPRPR